MIHPFDHELLVEATDPLPFPNPCPCGSERIKTEPAFGRWVTYCDDCYEPNGEYGAGDSERASILDWNEQVPE